VGRVVELSKGALELLSDILDQANDRGGGKETRRKSKGKRGGRVASGRTILVVVRKQARIQGRLSDGGAGGLR